ncbi:MAG: hypothetical protein KDK76_06290 [Chlamydiia bacterium]|nr:hypothetical protein [Chlamydiia bacterium]
MEKLQPSPDFNPYYQPNSPYSLSGRGITKLEESHFAYYRNEEIVDLSGNSLRFIPGWIANYPIKKLIVNNNQSPFDLTFHESIGKKKDLKVEVLGNGFYHPPKGLREDQVICEIDFTSSDYHDQFTQISEQF